MGEELTLESPLAPKRLPLSAKYADPIRNRRKSNGEDVAAGRIVPWDWLRGTPDLCNRSFRPAASQPNISRPRFPKFPQITGRMEAAQTPQGSHGRPGGLISWPSLLGYGGRSLGAPASRYLSPRPARSPIRHLGAYTVERAIATTPPEPPLCPPFSIDDRRSKFPICNLHFATTAYMKNLDGMVMLTFHFWFVVSL